MIVVYGLTNCSTCRIAMKWLQSIGLEPRLHDFRVDGLEEKKLNHWIALGGWEQLLNQRGTTWRKLHRLQKSPIDKKKASALMLCYPALIKRPVIEIDEGLLIGFKDEQKQVLKSK